MARKRNDLNRKKVLKKEALEPKTAVGGNEGVRKDSGRKINGGWMVQGRRYEEKSWCYLTDHWVTSFGGKGGGGAYRQGRIQHQSETDNGDHKGKRDQEKSQGPPFRLTVGGTKVPWGKVGLKKGVN